MSVFYCMLQVSWLRRHGDKLNLLSVGPEKYSNDPRYTPGFRAPHDWQLRLQNSKQTDQGFYECQVSSHPPIIQRFYLTVVGKSSYSFCANHSTCPHADFTHSYALTKPPLASAMNPTPPLNKNGRLKSRLKNNKQTNALLYYIRGINKITTNLQNFLREFINSREISK